MNKITEAISTLPREISKEFHKKMKEMFHNLSDSLHQTDQIFLKHLADHKEIVLAPQKKNENSIKLLSDKVFELSSSHSDFKSMVMQQMKQTD